ncbi:hypothetical protein [Dankookia sp. P2]|uniref:hypothetical protein n=1 Tax=Dankookia sp. P2 TaxID=3423955 RepID=UPI003D670516
MSRAIEDTVLPRLLLTRGTATPRTDLDAVYGAAPTAADVESLCALLVVDDQAAALALVEGLRGRGVTLPRIYLDLLAPAARWLGEAWEDDRADFSTVTLGLMRLQHMVRDYDDALTRGVRPQSRTRRVLLLNPPGSSTASAATCWPPSSARRAGMSGTRRRGPPRNSLRSCGARASR